MLIDLAENMIFHGFRRIVFINGHGGNIVPAKQALYELRPKLRSRSDLLLLLDDIELRRSYRSLK